MFENGSYEVEGFRRRHQLSTSLPTFKKSDEHKIVSIIDISSDEYSEGIVPKCDEPDVESQLIFSFADQADFIIATDANETNVVPDVNSHSLPELHSDVRKSSDRDWKETSNIRSGRNTYTSVMSSDTKMKIIKSASGLNASTSSQNESTFRKTKKRKEYFSFLIILKF